MGMKKTEEGMIPEEWRTQNFAETFRVLNNNTFSRSDLNYDGGEYINIHYGDVLIQFPEVLDCATEDIPFINNDVKISGSAQPLQNGDIVIADTAEDETVGKSTELVNVSKKIVMAGLHTIPCRVKDGEFAPKWLGYYMNSHQYHDQLLPYIHGTKVSSIAKGDLGETVIVIPPTEEQEKIVEALSDVDSLIIDLEKLIQKYQMIKQGCLEKMFPREGETVPEMRMPGFTGDWEQRKLGQIVKVGSGRDYKHLSAGNIPVYGTGGYMLSVNEALSEREDAIGIGRKGTIDNPYILQAPFWTVDTLFYVIPSKETDLNFLFDTFQNIDWKSKDESTGVPSLSKNTITETEVLIPTLKEQTLIGKYFKNFDNLLTLHQRKLKKYKDIKQGMMEELLTGKVRLI